MSTNKYYKKYASGGRFQNRRIDDGTAAMEQQVKAELSGIRRAGEQVTKQRNQHLKSLDRKAQLEAENRRRVYEFEADISKTQQASEDRNHQSRLNSLKQEEAEYQKKAKMWADLSPTLTETFLGLANEVKTFHQTKKANEQFQKDLADGTIGKLMTTLDLATRNANLIDIANTQVKAAKGVAKGDAAAQYNFDYITKVSLSNNPVYQELVFDHLERNINGNIDEFLNYINTQTKVKVNGQNVVALFQYRAAEQLRQYGVNHNSKLGVQVMRLYTSRAETMQQRLTLEDREYEIEKLNENFAKGLTVLSKGPVLTDPPNPAALKLAKQANYEKMNSFYTQINANLIAKPVRNKNGLKVNESPNINSLYDAWAEDYMKHFAFFDDFVGVFYGKTEDNPYGYLIPEATRGSTKKTDYILGKHPTKINELAVKFDAIKKAADKAEDTRHDLKQQQDAQPFIDKLDTGYYKDKKDEFFTDWENNSGNPHIKDALGPYLGLKSDNLNENTINSTLVQTYKAGDFKGFYNSWAVLPDSEQSIGAGNVDPGTSDMARRIKGLQELAIAEAVPLNKLDNKLRDYTKGKIEDVIKMTNRSQVAHSSAQGMPDRALAWLLEKYNSYPSGIPASDKLRQAKTELESMLGIDGVDVVDPNDGGYRGVGEFRQKVGKSGTTNSVIFLSEAGKMYGDVSALEVDMEMERLSQGRREESSLREAKLNTLANFVYSKDGSQRITEAELDELSMTGETSNDLINHLMSKEVLGDIPHDDFINKLLETNPTYKELTPDQQILKKWGGNKWCTHMLGNTNPNVNNTKRAVLAACIQAIEAEFGTPDDIGKNARTILLNRDIRNRLRQGGDELE